jgi:hypothetical protein
MTKPSEPNRPSARARNSKRRDRCYDTCRDAIRFVSHSLPRKLRAQQRRFELTRSFFFFSNAAGCDYCYYIVSPGTVQATVLRYKLRDTWWRAGPGRGGEWRESSADVFFHDSLHTQKKKSGSIRSNRSRGGGSYERARIKEKQRGPKGEKHEFDGFRLWYYTVESGDKITR